MSSSAFRVVITTSVKRWWSALRTAETVRTVHFDAPIDLVVVDDRYGQCVSAMVALSARDLVDAHWEPGEFDRLLALNTPDQLVDLLRPLIVLQGIERNTGMVVISLPDDAEVVGPLDEFAVAGSGGIALSVVRSTPIPRDGRLPDDVDLLADGVIDHEVFAASGAGIEVLNWWITQARRHRFVEDSRMQTSRVRWLDQAKHLFPTLVFEMPRVTRSYRNADESAPGSAPLLRLVEFDPTQPWSASPKAGIWPRIILSEHSDLAAAALRRKNAWDTTEDPTFALAEPYAHLASGYPYDTVMRSLYAEALHAAERHELQLPPNPFADPNHFTSWLRDDIGHGVSRYLHGILQVHADVAKTLGEDTGALRQWARESGAERGFSPSLTGVLPRGPSTAFDPAASSTSAVSPSPIGTPSVTKTSITTTSAAKTSVTPGINLVGLFKAEMGVGEAARLTFRSVQASGIPHSLVLDTGTAHRQDDPFDMRADQGFRHDVNVVVANADALPQVVQRHDQRLDDGRAVFDDLPTIGFWFWETATFPDKYNASFRLVDEVWVASRHVHDAIAPVAARHGVPVKVFPLGANAAADRIPSTEAARCAEALGVPPDRFCFYFSFDHRSVAERKNPWGLIEAFCLAFPKAAPSGPVLVIKSISGEVDLLGRERLRWMASRRPDIVLIEGFVNVETRHALLCRSDAYISLHRAEGWGLTMAEAMSLGIPTIATGYSGNLEFMTDANSWLIDFELTPIANDVAHYGGIGSWAEPNIRHAANVMAQFVDNREDWSERAQRGADDLKAMANGQAGARFVIDRVRSVRNVDLQARHRNQRAHIRCDAPTAHNPHNPHNQETS